MKKRADTRSPAARRIAAALSPPLVRLGLYALGASAAGFLLAAAQIGASALPAAIALTAALPFSLAAVCSYAGAALGYFVFWGASGAAEPASAGFLILAASCLFHDVIPASRRYFLPGLSAGIYAMTGLIFLLSAPVHVSAAAILAGKTALIFLCSVLFSGLSEKRPEAIGALGVFLLASASRLTLLPGLPLSLVLSGCAVLLCSGSRFFLLAACGCSIILEASFRPGYSAGALLCLGAIVCHYTKPRFALVRGSLFFLTLAAGSFVFGAGETMFPPAMFLGTLLGLVLWKPAQALLSGQEAPLDAAREKSLTAASGALWSLAANLQRGCTSGLEPQSAAVFDKAAEEICRSCAKWSVCWEQNAQETFRLLSRASRGILRRGEAKRDDLPPLFLARCCHTDSFLRAVNDALSTQLAKVQYQSRLAESRQILCDQYRVLSRLLQNLAEPSQAQAEPDQYAPELGFRATGLRGSNISGDSGASFRVGEWYYLLLCDGMGSGEQARDEAVSASALLKELIESGIDAHDAMQTINGLYILRDGGGFAAIDLLQVSLVTAEGFLHKWGAAPSFLKFGRTVQRLGSALPPPGLGVGRSYGPECLRVSLQRGEALILTSDGVDAELASRYLLGCGELSVRELAAGVVGSSEDAMPDDRTAAVLRLRLTESRSRTKKRVLSRIGML